MDDWIEIFKTGPHTDNRGRTWEWTEADLDKMVSTYNPDYHEAPVVIGQPQHDDPAYAWVKKLKRVGQQLMAKFIQVDPDFAQMLKDGRFNKRGVSFYSDGSLRQVVYLGAPPPNTSGLKSVGFSDIDYCLDRQGVPIEIVLELSCNFAEGPGFDNGATWPFENLTSRV